MDRANQFEWVGFYKELAGKLRTYRNNRADLVAMVRQIYNITGLNLPTLERDTQLVDIDPFTFFGLFNKTSMKEENRIKIVSVIADLFEIKAPVPTSFDSIPLLNNQNATFYYFVDQRQARDIDDLWELFLSALTYAENPTQENRSALSKYFDLTIKRKGNGNSKITMGLYWIAPDTYLSLDQRNSWYIYESGKIPASLVQTLPAIHAKISFVKYFDIVEKLRVYLQSQTSEIKDFKNLSFEAWKYSEYVNHQKKASAEEHEKADSKASFIKWFKPVIDALKDLGGSGTPEQVRDRIIENEKLDEKTISETRGTTQHNKFSNEVAWARNYLVYGGYIDKTVRGVWTLTEKGKTAEMTHELASQIFFDGIKRTTDRRKAEENALADNESQAVHYWLYSPGENAGIWDECYNKGIMAIGWDEIGDLNQYASKTEMKEAMKEHIDPGRPYTMAAHATWQFANEIKLGDVIFAKKGRNTVVGRGIVLSDYSFDDTREDNKNVRAVNWTHKGEWPHPGQAAMKTLTDITSYTDYVEKLSALFENEEDDDDGGGGEVSYPPYNKDKFLEEVYMDASSYEKLVALVQNKKNVILQGAPGVGKTFAAKRLAYSIMGAKDPNRVMMVQFHQSYSYEDFIMGFRPSETGFELRHGAFYSFCKKAEIDSDNDYFFIIDEINRGNMSKIFGELFMLIENDKRGIELQLLYSDEKFSVPSNVYLIGMMNTADRSLAMLDYALRRRFAFFEMKPGFDTEGFRDYRTRLASEKFDRLIHCVENLNAAISADESLGEGFCIGHSYFCNLKTVTDNSLTGIVEYELIPLLKEYWFDEPTKVKDWSNNLRSAIK